MNIFDIVCGPNSTKCISED